MSSPYSTKSVCVPDNGIFSELARTLAKSFGKVWYTSPWVSGFPGSAQLEISEGMVEVERIDDILEVVHDCDLFVFPDIYQGTAQTYLASLGKRVWGSRKGDELEIYRKDAKKHFARLGIPQGEYKAVQGMNAVRTYIKAHDGEKLWIKGNKARGDFETFCVEGSDLGKNKLDDIEARLGPVASTMTFIIEKNITDSIDLAIDTHCILGAYPSVAVLGTEEKGECYVGVVKPWMGMPPQLRDMYERLSETFKEYGYRNFLSLESRAKGKQIILGDPCCRAGSPPLELQLNWITNLPRVFWEGAEGRMVDPVYDGRYGVELIVHSDWADKHPLLVDFPMKLRDKIKFRYQTEFDGKTWILPQGAGPRIAAIVAHGDSLDACIEECTDISAQLKGTQIESFTRSFPIIKDKMHTLAQWGIDF